MATHMDVLRGRRASDKRRFSLFRGKDGLTRAERRAYLAAYEAGPAHPRTRAEVAALRERVVTARQSRPSSTS